MINNIFSHSQHIQVYTGSQQHINSNPNSGALRYNTMSQTIEVNDGYSWYPVGRSVELSISTDLDRVINWARIKMDEEERIRQKAALFPTIRDALDELNKAKDKLEVLDKLCDEKELNNAQKAA